MKDRLNPEESQRLIELGVDPSKASEVKEFDDELSQWTHRGNPIFTLADVLSLLPKEIYSEARDITYYLTIETRPFGSSVRYANPGYRKSFGPTKSFPELIDALFELLCWVLQITPTKSKSYETDSIQRQTT